MILSFDFAGFISKALSQASWEPFPVYLPSAPESWLLVLAFCFLLTVSVWMMLHRPSAVHQMRIRKRTESWAEDFGIGQWNVVQLRGSDAKKFWPERYADEKSGFLDKAATLRINGKSVSCRVLINNKAPEGELLLHSEIWALYDPVLEKIGNELRHTDGSMTVNAEIFTPWYRPDLMTVYHPDTDLRMQWRLGMIFLLLGVVIPEIIRSIG